MGTAHHKPTLFELNKEQYPTCTARHASKEKDTFTNKKHTSAPALGAFWILRDDVELCGPGQAEMDNHGAVVAETARCEKDAGHKSVEQHRGAMQLRDTKQV